MIQSHLQQQNFELMKDLQEKNQEQMRDISAELQTGLEAFLKQSMEQMFNRMTPPQTAPPPQASSTCTLYLLLRCLLCCKPQRWKNQ